MPLPDSIGRYQIRAELGRGGMATVYRAYDPRIKREVAVKVLPRELLHKSEFRARFEREAETIAALEHAAIVTVYDYGEEDDQPYFVMRFMTGGSLADRIEKSPLSLTEAARIFSRLAPALDWAHAHGIIHRDLKPGNILFDEHDNPYISDFGIAKLAQASVTFTGSAIVGTPAYMSPEQARGEKLIDGRSDIYALGAIVFQMLTGKFPYEADTPMGMVVKHITDPVPRILDVRPELPKACERVIERAMAKDRGDRFATASALAETLVSVARHAGAWPIPIPPAPVSAPSTRPLRETVTAPPLPLPIPQVPAGPSAAEPPASKPLTPQPRSKPATRPPRETAAEPPESKPPTPQPLSKPATQPPREEAAEPPKRPWRVLWVVVTAVEILVLGSLIAAGLYFGRSALFGPTPTATPRPSATELPSATAAPPTPTPLSAVPPGSDGGAQAAPAMPSTTPTTAPTFTSMPAPTSTAKPAWVTNFAEPILAAIANRRPKFQDDFNNQSSGWSAAEWCVGRMKYADGEMVISPNCQVSHPKVWYPDFVAEIDARFLPGDSQSSRWRFFYRSVTGGAGYNYGFRPDGTVEACFLQSGSNNADECMDVPGWILFEPSANHILIIAKGQTFALYVNDQPKFYQDRGYVWPNGGIMLEVQNRPVAFDNFKIWDISDLSSQ